MNREIKFRAWDKKNKRWIDRRQDEDRITASLPLNGYFLLETWFQNGSFCNDIEIIQYTGLTDKKDVEIYEGDIVKTYWVSMSSPKNNVGYVKWKDNSARFMITDGLKSQALTSNRVEVIGNIYENPELLEERNDRISEQR